MGEGQGQEPSYRAFMSYSHRDDAMARSLHRQLETYRLPKHLIGSETPRGLVTPRLTPIFRDLDELSAADDLSAEIKAALARSEVLIILASPAAKASKWVNLEIETFRALHGNSRPVLVALLEGEPEDAFPPALTAGGTEPVAADFRREASGGKRLALLKLVAGISGAPLDSLVQRDAQRQLRRVTAITGGALAAVLVMALLLFVALRAQADAERQRQEAEGLVDYMLTDLREQLKGVGRLEVMTAVNERAMKYYGGDTPKAMLLKARILHALGEDDERRGEINSAQTKFQQAFNISTNLLAENPHQMEIIFVHAQSEYWIGYLHYLKKEFDSAYMHWRNYRFLALQLIENNANEAKNIREASYATTNLCLLLVGQPRLRASKITEVCEEAVVWKRRVKAVDPGITSEIDLANALAWLADAVSAEGNQPRALKLRQEQSMLVDSVVERHPNNLEHRDAWIAAQLGLANQEIRSNFTQTALNRLLRLRQDAQNLVNSDSLNKKWRSQLSKIENKISEANREISGG